MSRPDRFLRILCLSLGLAIGLVTLGGCARDPFQLPAVHVGPLIQPAPVLTLLSYAHRLAQTTPAGREEAVRAARRQVQAGPNAMSYAYLALALGSPHQHLYTPDEAARYARLALDSDQAPWDTDARQYLSDYARLYDELAAADEDDDKQRIAELQKRLAKAHQKLNALSKLENRLDNVENSP